MALAFNNRYAENTKAERIARLLSDVVNPLLVSPLVILIIGLAEHLPYRRLVLLLTLTSFFYTVIPFGIALLICYRHPVHTLDFIERNSRKPLYIYSLLSIFACNLLIIGLFQNFIIRVLVFIFLINLLSSFVINFKWKVSIHSVSLSTGGLLLLLYGLHGSAGFLSVILGSILTGIILPLVMWSRYRLNIHTKPEIFGGAATGFFLTLLVVFILLYFP